MAELLIDSLANGGVANAPPGEADPPFLDLQDPAPLATGILINDNIEVRVNDIGDGVDLTTVVIDVTDGATVNAYDGGAGGFQNGYTGTVTPSGLGFFFDINPPADFTDLQVISVRVRATDLSPLLNTLDQTYTFTSADGRPPFLTAQNPAPSATGVPQNSNIAFTITDLASSVIQATVQVTVNQGGGGAVNAVVNGNIVAPFDGAGSSVTPVGNGFLYVLDPTSDLIEQNSVVISVIADDAAANTFNGGYSFTTGDQTAPSVVPVDPLALATIPPAQNVIFDIIDLGTGIDLPTLNIEFDEGSGFANVYTGGSFVAPYDGPGSSVVAVTNGFRVTVDKTSDLAALSVISVRTQVDDTNANMANVTYTFNTTDSGTIDIPVVVPNVGEGPIDLTGTVPVGTYLVYVGPNGDDTDPQVYNGDPGTGGVLVTFETIPNSGGKTKPTKDVFIPPLPVGGPYQFTFVPQPSGSTLNSPPTVTVLGENFADRAISLRRMQPPWLAVGPRSPGKKGFPQS